MNVKLFSEAMSQLDSKYVHEAINYKKKARNHVWAIGGAAAACFCIMILIGFYMFRTNNSSSVSIGGVTRNYKDVHILESESAIEWPWEYRTIAEQYTIINLNGKEYSSRGRSVDASLVSEQIGTFDVMGYDAYTGQNHKMASDIYRIGGISEAYIVAAELDGEFYVFNYNEYNPPANFGEMLEKYALEQTLSLNQFAKYNGYEENGFYKLDDDGYIWDVLNACRDADFIEDDGWDEGDRRYLSFTTTSDALGIYKRAFHVTEDGYIWTNIADYAYIFRIGREAADKILSYAAENGIASDPEPYNFSLAGTLMETADDYILVDDTILCSDENDGMTFKVPLHDLRIRRCIDFEGIGVGDLVVVYFTGNINTDAGNVIEEAFSLSKGSISDGEMSVAE